MKLYLSLFVLATIATSNGQVVVPNGLANVEGNSSFVFFTGIANTRRYQMTVAANQLTGLINSNINGIQLRLDVANSQAWPLVSGTISRFDMYMGAGVAPASTSSIFASNYTSAPTQVRSGSLALNQGEYHISDPFHVQPWGPTIDFQTPYHYSGGNLTFEFQYVGVPAGLFLTGFDGSWNGDAGNGTDYTSNWATSIDDSEAQFIHGISLVTRFTTAVPEPASFVVLGLGIIALASKRRMSRFKSI